MDASTYQPYRSVSVLSVLANLACWQKSIRPMRGKPPSWNVGGMNLRAIPSKSFRRGCSAPSAAEQIDVRAHGGEGVARRVDAVHPGDRVKDDLPPLGLQLVHALIQDKCAELHYGPALGPEGGGIGHLIPHLGQLNQHLEPRRRPGQPARQFGGEEV